MNEVAAKCYAILTIHDGTQFMSNVVDDALVKTRDYDVNLCRTNYSPSHVLTAVWRTIWFDVRTVYFGQ